MPIETRRAVEARFYADMARRHPGSTWHIEADADCVRQTDVADGRGNEYRATVTPT